MTIAAKGPPPGHGGDPLELSSLGGVDLQDKPPNPAATQVKNLHAVHEATIASILDQSHWLLGSLTLQASIAQQYAELGDARGFLYSLDQVVKQAIRAGAEGVELRKIRKDMREARASDR
jgi:hypothetical protein